MHRHSQLEVHLVPEKSCWVALPPAYVARLLEGQSPIPLVLQLTSASGISPLGDLHATVGIPTFLMSTHPAAGCPSHSWQPMACRTRTGGKKLVCGLVRGSQHEQGSGGACRSG